MPIRFRCAHCDQLLGIARRKAGSVVECPRCRKQLIVPQPEPAEAAAPGSSPGGNGNQPGGKPAAPLFERDDFDELLDQPVAVPPPAASRQRPPAPAPSAQTVATPEPLQRPAVPILPSPIVDVEPYVPPPGLYLSRTAATWLSAAAVLALAVAFAVGLLVGMLLRPHDDPKTSLIQVVPASTVGSDC